MGENLYPGGKEFKSLSLSTSSETTVVVVVVVVNADLLHSGVF